MKVPPALMVASALAVLLQGCSTTEEPAAKPAAPVPAPRTEPPAGVQVRTSADTVNALHAAEHGTVGQEARAAGVRFTVQIGAFRDAPHASAVQAEARRRFHQAVLNDYHAGTGYYQIRIGFFATRVEARAFLERMRHDYPADYRDSWIVHLRR